MSTSTRLDVTVKCDWIGCHNRFPYNHVESIDYARARARANGWSSKSDSDYCREHTAP